MGHIPQELCEQELEAEEGEGASGPWSEDWTPNLGKLKCSRRG